jgi:hypothetical protein
MYNCVYLCIAKCSAPESSGPKKHCIFVYIHVVFMYICVYLCITPLNGGDRGATGPRGPQGCVCTVRGVVSDVFYGSCPMFFGGSVRPFFQVASEVSQGCCPKCPTCSRGHVRCYLGVVFDHFFRWLRSV